MLADAYRKNDMLKVIFIFLFIFSTSAFAQLAYLSCNGTLSCQGCSDSKKTFDLVINTKSGEMSDFPIVIAHGCASAYEPKENYTITETTATHKCISPNMTSSLILSRRTGMLSTSAIPSITSINNTKDAISIYGEFKCTKSPSKIF